MKPTLEILESRYLLTAVFPDDTVDDPIPDCPDLPDLCGPSDYGSDSADGAGGNDSIPGGM